MTQSQIKIFVAGLHILLVLLRRMSWIFLGGRSSTGNSESVSLHLLLLRILLPALCLPEHLRETSPSEGSSLRVVVTVKT